MMLFLLLVLNVFIAVAQKNDPDKKEWQTIFNGKNLDGWDIKISGQPLNDNYKNTFRIEDGMLRVSYQEYQTFDDKYGHLYYKKPLSHYMVRFQYRFTGNQTPGGATWNVRNSGIMLHSQSAKSLTFNQEFPVSLEMQLLGGLGKGERQTGNLCSPGTIAQINGHLDPTHCIDSNSPTFDGDQWVTAEAIVLGDSIIHHLINGKIVLTYTKPQIAAEFVRVNDNWQIGKVENYQEWLAKKGTPLKEGYIALQAESHPIDFKNIELLNLKGCTDPKAKNYKSYYVASDNCDCKYSLGEKIRRVFK